MEIDYFLYQCIKHNRYYIIIKDERKINYFIKLLFIIEMKKKYFLWGLNIEFIFNENDLTNSCKYNSC